MPKKLKLAISIALLVIVTVLVIQSVKRDLIYKSDYNSDLRNRVVGARLLYDGKSPYFYKWKKEDGIRYYEPNSFDDEIVSPVTTSPFFLYLIIPICNLQQTEIANIWLVIEYILIGIITLIGVYLSNTFWAKTAAITTGVAFLFTDAWKSHIIAGQMYITIPFLMALFTLLLIKSKNYSTDILCGCIAAALLFVRPNSLVLFLPLLLFIKQTGYKKTLLISLPALAVLLLIVTNNFELSLWKGYFMAIKEHIHVHQGEAYTHAYGDANPHYVIWEGLDMSKTDFLKPEMPIFPKTESGNFFVLCKLLLHKAPGTELLATISICSIITASLLFYRTQKKYSTVYPPAHVLIIFGFCLYMITDLCSPLYRNQYYTVQWVFAIMLFFSFIEVNKNKWFVMAIVTGIVLNILRIPFIKMEHTIGEYLIMVTLLFFCFKQIKKPAIEK